MRILTCFDSFGPKRDPEPNYTALKRARAKPDSGHTCRHRCGQLTQHLRNHMRDSKTSEDTPTKQAAGVPSFFAAQSEGHRITDLCRLSNHERQSIVQTNRHFKTGNPAGSSSAMVYADMPGTITSEDNRFHNAREMRASMASRPGLVEANEPSGRLKLRFRRRHARHPCPTRSAQPGATGPEGAMSGVSCVGPGLSTAVAFKVTASALASITAPRPFSSDMTVVPLAGNAWAFAHADFLLGYLAYTAKSNT